ncbi:hypothetical protein EAO70_06060 [Streptomyces sp. adm13(2018)]|uniref:hypothetical protein n=1 Tax=Streptomyces sp. adm13(2018) TaxID=2479007 RepID=UPI0011CE5C0B|nr:hypothetical protein [Streptomyces sp. adm13(2018)]TXS22423.1 hypothetical protein EAO70_06060 [Streptomyces sp. adm13(2018)]
MTETLDAPIAAVADAVNAFSDPGELYRVSREAESRVTEGMRAIRQKLVLGLRDQGLTWRSIGELLGGVSPQRAEQISRGV